MTEILKPAEVCLKFSAVMTLLSVAVNTYLYKKSKRVSSGLLDGKEASRLAGADREESFARRRRAAAQGEKDIQANLSAQDIERRIHAYEHLYRVSKLKAAVNMLLILGYLASGAMLVLGMFGSGKKNA